MCGPRALYKPSGETNRPQTAGCVPARTITPEKGACLHLLPTGFGKAPLFPLLDLARAKSGHCPDGRACPPGGRRVRARPVRRGRISHASGVPMAPCLRACALWQRPGGPSTGRSADRAGAMKQALRWESRDRPTTFPNRCRSPVNPPRCQQQPKQGNTGPDLVRRNRQDCSYLVHRVTRHLNRKTFTSCMPQRKGTSAPKS